MKPGGIGQARQILDPVRMRLDFLEQEGQMLQPVIAPEPTGMMGDHGFAGLELAVLQPEADKVGAPERQGVVAVHGLAVGEEAGETGRGGLRVACAFQLGQQSGRQGAFIKSVC